MSAHDCEQFRCSPSQDLHYDRDGSLLYVPDGQTEMVTVNTGNVLALRVALDRDDPAALRQAAQALYDDVTG